MRAETVRNGTCRDKNGREQYKTESGRDQNGTGMA